MVSSASAVDPNAAGDNAGYQNYTGKTQVYPGLTAGESTGILIFAGQSLIANTVNALYTPSNAKAHCLSIYNGGMYTAVDPQLGCDSFAGCGSSMGRIADKCITAGIWTRVIVVPCATNGSLISQHDVGGNEFWHYGVVKSRLAALGLTATAICWDQGTSDANASTPQATYQASFNSMVTAVRALGLTCPWFVAESTIQGFAGSAPAQAIRAAQVAVLNSGATIYAGPDTDAVTSRYDGTHMDATGSDDHATRWKVALDAVF